MVIFVTLIFANVKKISAFILLIVFSIQTFYSAGVTVWFFANQKLLAKKHCINKSRPELKCDGKCFLSKKIKEAEQKEEQQAPYQVKWVETSPCTLSSYIYTLSFAEADIISGIDKNNTYSFLFLQSIFHPPGVC